MRSKEKLVLFLLFFVFLLTAGMFFYQNVYLKQQDEANQVPIYVALYDIPKGTTLSEENVGMMKLDKEKVLPSYITNFDDLADKVVNSEILKNEVITEGRLTDEGKEDNTFKVLVKPSNKLKVEQGDVVNVYVQVKERDKEDKSKINYVTYHLLSNKSVAEVEFKKNSSGKVQEGNIEGVVLHLSEQDALNVHIASFMKELDAQIIVLPYQDLLANENLASVEEFEKSLHYTEYQEDETKVENGQAEGNRK